MADRNKILETIARMSKLTEDAGAFRGEASAAAAKIQALMEKYAISQMDIKNYLADKQQKEFQAAFTSVQSEFKHNNVQAWEWSLARLIASITMTRYYVVGRGNSKRYGKAYGARFVFFGVEENAKLAAEFYELWHKNIEEMAEQARWANVLELKKKYGHHPKFRHWIKENRPDEDPQYFRSSWITGCLHAMHEKVYEERKAREKEREQSTAGSGSALMIVSYEKAVDRAYNEQLGSIMKVVKTGSSKGFNGAGYRSGRDTGSRIKVGSKQLGGE